MKHTKGQHHVLSTYSCVAAGTHLNGHMAGLSTDGTETRRGYGGEAAFLVCVRCHGEGAHAEVAD